MSDNPFYPYHCATDKGLTSEVPPHTGIPLVNNSHKMAKQLIKLSRTSLAGSRNFPLRRVKGSSVSKGKKVKYW